MRELRQNTQGTSRQYLLQVQLTPGLLCHSMIKLGNTIYVSINMEMEQRITLADNENDKQLKIIDAGIQDNRRWQSYLKDG